MNEKKILDEDTSFADIMHERERRLGLKPIRQKGLVDSGANIGQTTDIADNGIPTAPIPTHAESESQEAVAAQVAESYCYKDDGCQNKKFQRLKQGKMKISARNDLHGCTVRQAERQLSLFLHQLVLHRNECALVICGKGLHSSDGRSVIKHATAALMRTHTSVLAYCPALQKDGGHGAFYVLMRQIRGIKKP